MDIERNKIMFYIIINTVALLFSIVISLIVANKFAKTKTQKFCLILVVFLVLGLITSSASIRISNYFISFDDPESVYHLSHSEEIVDMVYGDDSCMIVFSKGKNKYEMYYVPKSEKGYKIPKSFSTKIVDNYFVDNGSFNVYNVSGTNDYYIVGMIIASEAPATIVNSDNKKVKYMIIDSNGLDTKTISIYDYINDFTDDYYIMLDDEKISLK